MPTQGHQGEKLIKGKQAPADLLVALESCVHQASDHERFQPTKGYVLTATTSQQAESGRRLELRAPTESLRLEPMAGAGRSVGLGHDPCRGDEDKLQGGREEEKPKGRSSVGKRRTK